MATKVSTKGSDKCRPRLPLARAVLALVVSMGLAGTASANDAEWRAYREYCEDSASVQRHIHHHRREQKRARKRVQVHHHHHYYNGSVYDNAPEPARYQPVVYHESPRENYVRTVPRTQITSVGSLLGAAVGGLLGSNIGSGSGQLVATAGGAVAGYILGGEIERAGYRY